MRNSAKSSIMKSYVSTSMSDETKGHILGICGHDFVLGTTVSCSRIAGVHFNEIVGYRVVVISRVINDGGCSVSWVVALFMSSRQVAAGSVEFLKNFQSQYMACQGG